MELAAMTFFSEISFFSSAAKNPNTLWIVSEFPKPGVSGKRLLGIFKILPLNSNGVSRIERGLSSGTTLSPDEIVARRGNATGLYVGDVAGYGRVGRAYVMAFWPAPNTATYVQPVCSVRGCNSWKCPCFLFFPGFLKIGLAPLVGEGA